MGLRPAKFHERLDRLSARLRGAGPRPALMGLAAVATWQLGDLPHEPADLPFLAFPYFQWVGLVFRPCQLTKNSAARRGPAARQLNVRRTVFLLCLIVAGRLM